MTLPPNKIGDRGQRYEVRYVLHADLDTIRVLGWTDSQDEAFKMADTFMLAPYVERAWTHDRQPAPEPPFDPWEHLP